MKRTNISRSLCRLVGRTVDSCKLVVSRQILPCQKLIFRLLTANFKVGTFNFYPSLLMAE